MQNQNLNLKSNNLKIRSYRFSLNVIAFLIASKKDIFYVITDQLLRAATSIGANIIEAQAASSKKDFVRYFEISLKSANETKYWICLIRDSYPQYKENICDLLQEADEISKMLGSSILTMKGKKKI